MDSQLLERTRSMLRTRVESADGCLQEMFGFACKHLLVWLEANPFLAPQVQVLDRIACESRIGDELRSRGSINGLLLIRTARWEELAALNFAALRAIAGKHILDDIAAFRAVARALCGVDHQPAPMVLEVLRRGMLWGLRAYFEEALDGQVAVLSLLKKYKQRSEWYRRTQLRALAADAPFQGRRRGEPSLMMDLYEYVHDQGVDFRIESWSASGQADLISEIVEGQRLVLDGKFARRGHSAALTCLPKTGPA